MTSPSVTPEQRDSMVLHVLWGSRPVQQPEAWSSADLVARHLRSVHSVDMTPPAVGRVLTRLAREGRCERQYRAGAQYRLMVEPEALDAVE